MRLYFIDKEIKVLDHTDFKGQSRYLNLESDSRGLYSSSYLIERNEGGRKK